MRLSCAISGALFGAIACGGDDPVREVEAGSMGGGGGSNETTGGESVAAGDGANAGNAGVMGAEEEPANPEDAGSEGGAEEDPTATTPNGPMQTLLTEYRGWQPRTDAPINVSADIFTLCRSPTLAENAFTESEHGESRMLMDWLNSAAHAGFESLGDSGFAPGAAIVKEKLSYRAGGVAPELVAIGIMLKHEPGFDSENGDWEFAYWEEEPGLIDGPDQSAYCAGCHASSPTDFVFLDDSWRDSSESE